MGWHRVLVQEGDVHYYRQGHHVCSPTEYVRTGSWTGPPRGERAPRVGDVRHDHHRVQALHSSVMIWVPLPREYGTTQKVLRTFNRKPRPESGLDCLTCATFARQRTTCVVQLIFVQISLIHSLRGPPKLSSNQKYLWYTPRPVQASPWCKPYLRISTKPLRFL